MTAMTPLEQALAAWGRVKDPDNRQPQVDDAVALGETEVFSNSNISLITGLGEKFVASLTGKTDKRGGRLNPETLPFLYDIEVQWRQARACDPRLVVLVLNAGTAGGMIAKLTGVPRSRIYRIAQEHAS